MTIINMRRAMAIERECRKAEEEAKRKKENKKKAPKRKKNMPLLDILDNMRAATGAKPTRVMSKDEFMDNFPYARKHAKIVAAIKKSTEEPK